MLFGQMPLAEFLRDYWQKKPCLFRQALPDFDSPLSMDEVAGLALEADIESRLVREAPASGPAWAVECGPFTDTDLSGLPESGWSLLVQAVDQWVPEVRAVLDEFGFLPAWRLDDIMISLAPSGGSVGPHFDQYDVFLLQAEGQRDWQLGGYCDADTPLLAGVPLSILADGIGQPSARWTLEPGDILYLPPRLAHHGVALTPCMTWSVGFRAPDVLEALQGLAQRAELDSAVDFMRYSDTDLTPQEALTAQIGQDSLRRLRATLSTVLARDDLLADWLGAYMTQNKYGLFDWSEVSEQTAPPEGTLVRQALPTRMTAFEHQFYVNGRAFALTAADQPLIDCLLQQDQWYWQELAARAHSATARRMLGLLLESGSLEISE